MCVCESRSHDEKFWQDLELCSCFFATNICASNSASKAGTQSLILFLTNNLILLGSNPALSIWTVHGLLLTLHSSNSDTKNTIFSCIFLFILHYSFFYSYSTCYLRHYQLHCILCTCVLIWMRAYTTVVKFC